MKEYTLKQFLDEFYNISQHLCKETDVDYLLSSKKMCIIRSAKQDVFEKFLSLLKNHGYNGEILVIGRQEDLRYKEQGLDIYVVNEDIQYNASDVQEVITTFAPDTIGMLYGNKVHEGHINLLEIVTMVKGKRFAVSREIEISELVEIEKYLCGKIIYDNFCEWVHLQAEE